eukprot:12758447-Alexandrium_andersonii.AAC.1
MAVFSVSWRSAVSAVAIRIGASSTGQSCFLPRARSALRMYCGGIEPTKPAVRMTSLTLL